MSTLKIQELNSAKSTTMTLESREAGSVFGGVYGNGGLAGYVTTGGAVYGNGGLVGYVTTGGAVYGNGGLAGYVYPGGAALSEG